MCGLMETHTLESGTITLSMAKEFMCGLMEESTAESGKEI